MAKKLSIVHTETPDGWIPLQLKQNQSKVSTISQWVKNYMAWCHQFNFKTMIGDHFQDNCERAFAMEQERISKVNN